MSRNDPKGSVQESHERQAREALEIAREMAEKGDKEGARKMSDLALEQQRHADNAARRRR